MAKKLTIKSNQLRWICTNCGKDATVAYIYKRNTNNWGGLVKKGERLCFSCGRTRLADKAIF